MVYLKRSAAADYLNLTRAALWLEQISPHQFLCRLVCLKSMSKPGSPEHSHVATILRAEGWIDDDDWPDQQHTTHRSDNDGSPAGNWVEDFSQRDVSPEDPIYIHFVAAVAGSRWRFIVGDPDPWPSVPHGHGWDDDRWKIDPYRGDTFFQGKPKDRVSRSELVAFWNNDRFRDYARGEIEHWEQSHRGWSWRVTNFRRLPRRTR
ncbi:MAG: hypothetical protein O9288_16025 [Novosphingobium sp.]|uniref:hypothetical protein n=1 Tax=Novosphingobium sp. TaxID=1874826 RepID=UPI0022C12E03|nr:hypothetical protein [Novosphingobium sp.]MCZ8036256.1 hypothetical protein [Novosphingobium sp.]